MSWPEARAIKEGVDLISSTPPLEFPRPVEVVIVSPGAPLTATDLSRRLLAGDVTFRRGAKRWIVSQSPALRGYRPFFWFGPRSQLRQKCPMQWRNCEERF
jgi:hypothetical protein